MTGMSIIELTYQCVASSFNGLSAVLSRILPAKRKSRRFFLSRRGLLDRISDSMSDETRPVYWFHASSLGEYQIARPLMLALRADGDKAVVLTFFSPTGVEALAGKSSDKTCADYIFPLPLDSRNNARHFIDSVKPTIAVFMVAELWHNFLSELKRRDIPTLLVSCLVRRDSRYFKWYGQFQRRMLDNFTMILVHDRQSRANLYHLGLGDKTSIVGDPLYDNALSIRDSEYHDSIIERFCTSEHKVFIAGSIHYDDDLELTASIIKRQPDVKFIVVPHDITDEGIEMIKDCAGTGTIVYSEVTDNTDLAGAHVLIVDFVGCLSRIYRYGTAAYVGGGFTRLLHSVIEPLVYGIPVCFGPRIERKANPLMMIDNGTGTMVCTPDEINNWWRLVIEQHPQLLDEVRDTAHKFTEENRGGADSVVSIIKSLAQ